MSAENYATGSDLAIVYDELTYSRKQKILYFIIAIAICLHECSGIMEEEEASI